MVKRAYPLPQETGGSFDAVHVRSTDWQAEHQDWFVESDRLVPIALQVPAAPHRLALIVPTLLRCIFGARSD